MTVLEKAKAKLDAAERGMSYGLPGYDRSNLQWWTAYIEGAEDQKREDADAIEALQAEVDKWTEIAFIEQSKALENFKLIPRNGRWIVEPEGADGINIYCSECGKNGQIPKWNYCPNCGSKMAPVIVERKEEKV